MDRRCGMLRRQHYFFTEMNPSELNLSLTCKEVSLSRPCHFPKILQISLAKTAKTAKMCVETRASGSKAPVTLHPSVVCSVIVPNGLAKRRQRHSQRLALEDLST